MHVRPPGTNDSPLSEILYPYRARRLFRFRRGGDQLRQRLYPRGTTDFVPRSRTDTPRKVSGKESTASLKLDLGDAGTYTESLEGEDGDIAIYYLDMAEMSSAGNPLTLTNLIDAQPSDIDAFYFYPVQTAAGIRLSDGRDYDHHLVYVSWRLPKHLDRTK
ncbi:hypothetical protein [Paenibacillus mendelii]|uniref:hypothetical protein n=1 Tax=Paenibacillus mendelii TaxID=206163 RepID=UPI002113DBBF|nr:hypothetical protein [Paenibacillus mendelii]MCQ6559163.1 hypothetical protein [Paenibacillus mendelii]